MGKITINVPLFKKMRDIIFFLRDNNFLSHFSGQGQFRGQKSRGPLKMSREMAQKVIVPKKKNYVLKFLKQRDIGIFMYPSAVVYCCCVLLSVVGCSCVLLCVVAC
jgi:hypothetical protein